MSKNESQNANTFAFPRRTFLRGACASALVSALSAAVGQEAPIQNQLEPNSYTRVELAALLDTLIEPRTPSFDVLQSRRIQLAY